jgi:MraZ protein
MDEKKFMDYTTNLINTSNNLNAQRRQLARVALGKSAQINIDSAKRILIPTDLLTMANIKKDVVIAGMGDLIEI